MNARALMTATAGAVLAVLVTASPALASGKGKKDIDTTVTQVNYQELTNKVTTEQENDIYCKDEGDVNVIVGSDIKNLYDSQKCTAENENETEAENEADAEID